ncbi:MAG TPA: hypothetical protein VIQ29_13415 [Ancylobacter sp.]
MSAPRHPSRLTPDQPPLAPFKLIYQEPREPPAGLCGVMNVRTFTKLDEARREATAMLHDRDRRPVQIVDANRQVIWDEYADL